MHYVRPEAPVQPSRAATTAPRTPDVAEHAARGRRLLRGLDRLRHRAVDGFLDRLLDFGLGLGLVLVAVRAVARARVLPRLDHRRGLVRPGVPGVPPRAIAGLLDDLEDLFSGVDDRVD